LRRVRPSGRPTWRRRGLDRTASTPKSAVRLAPYRQVSPAWENLLVSLLAPDPPSLPLPLPLEPGGKRAISWAPLWPLCSSTLSRIRAPSRSGSLGVNCRSAGPNLGGPDLRSALRRSVRRSVRPSGPGPTGPTTLTNLTGPTTGPTGPRSDDPFVARSDLASSVEPNGSRAFGELRSGLESGVDSGVVRRRVSQSSRPVQRD